MKKIKIYFFRGLALLLPTILTLWLFVWGYHFIQNNISGIINVGIVKLVMIIEGYELSDTQAFDQFSEFWVHGWGSIAGFIIALILVIIAGYMFAGVLGKAIWKMIENFMLNTPLLRKVYPHIKQVTDFIFTQDEEKKIFSKVCAVEFPRKGMWTIGFVTGTVMMKDKNGQEQEMVNVIVPHSPSPITGFVVIVPKEDVIAVDMTVEEALKFVISAGVIVPGFVIDESKRGKV
jgi:uncharacterized membrane protein